MEKYSLQYTLNDVLGASGFYEANRIVIFIDNWHLFYLSHARPTLSAS